jgi:hypothetical protein
MTLSPKDSFELIDLLKKIVGDVCHCDTDIEKESGDGPEVSVFGMKNFYDDPIWGDEICDHCQARFLIKRLLND